MRTASVIAPPPLAPGARVALVAPAGPITAADLEHALATTASLGWTGVPGTHVLDHHGYFAGTDRDRRADLNRALRDPSIDGVWCLRGGYGAMRLLESVDYDALARHPRALIGYSDITALHSAIAARVPGLVTFHGPTARASLPPFSRASLVRAVGGERGDPCGAAEGAHALRRGHAEGRLAGGNLALLASLAGTPYAPTFAGAIVVLEDVNEAVYRIDRMLHQLWLAGAFTGCRAILFGHCTNCPEPCDEDGRRTLADVVGEIANTLGVPAALGIPVGHVDAQWTLPLGAHAEVVVEEGGCRVHVAWPPTCVTSPAPILSPPPS